MNKTPFRIANDKARRLILSLSALAGVRQEGGASAVLPLIRRLGYVQLDSIRIVERAHHHILYSRHTGYRPRHLARLQGKAPALFEHWTHDACLIPMEHYPHWRHRFAANRARKEHWQSRFGDDRVLKTVRDHIATHGPSLARDFAHLGKGSGSWWGWGPAKAALEYLWRIGELAVTERDGFEKIYELAERVIPAALRTAKPSKAETMEWAHHAAFDRLGAATPKMLADFWKHASIPEATAWIETQKKKGVLMDVTLEAVPGERSFKAVARPDIEDLVAKLPEPTSRLRALSPFDPVLRDRVRLNRLFGFDYTIEVYVPGYKRKYGYYVFPLLEGARLVGRIDMKAERAANRLVVKGLWLEPRFKLTAQRKAKLERELARQAKLADVSEIMLPADVVRRANSE